MTKPFSHAEPYTAQLRKIEQQIKQHQLQAAALQLNLLTRLNPHDPRVYLLGSRLAEAAHNPDGMLQAARKAHQFAPQWPTATIHLAGVLASRSETEEAMLMAEKAIRQATEQAAPAHISPELLTQAAAIAKRLELNSQALQWLRQAEQISPADVSIRYKIGLTLTDSGEAARAVELFSGLLQQQPNSPSLLSARLQACLKAQQLPQAICDGEALLALEPGNESYQFYLDVARGLTPKTQPVALISGLFDGYASWFDRHSIVQLHYQLPREVSQMIHQWHPDRKVDVLDLGCGTGLLGLALGPIEGVLVGVDLSGAMLEQAARHQLYDSFHQVNLLDALQATPGELYHVIAALDVFIYVGNLENVVPNAYRILIPGGHLVFSCETGAVDGADYALTSSYRYTHQRSYAERLLGQAGFIDIRLEDRKLRQEEEQAVQGFLVTARKPPRAAGKSGSRAKKPGRRDA